MSTFVNTNTMRLDAETHTVLVQDVSKKDSIVLMAMSNTTNRFAVVLRKNRTACEEFAKSLAQGTCEYRNSVFNKTQKWVSK